MKLSDAMLKGFEMTGGRQITNNYCEGPVDAPTAVCASGAILLGATGIAVSRDTPANHALLPDYTRFRKAWGLRISDANDEGMPWEHIYGMARAIGI